MTTVSSDFESETAEEAWRQFLYSTPEWTLLQEYRDIGQELMMLMRVYNQQTAVVKEFRRVIISFREEEARAEWAEWQSASKRMDDLRSQGDAPLDPRSPGEIAIINRLDIALSWHLGSIGLPYHPEDREALVGRGAWGGASIVPVHEAEALLEDLDGRRTELEDMEEMIARMPDQVRRATLFLKVESICVTSTVEYKGHGQLTRAVIPNVARSIGLPQAAESEYSRSDYVKGPSRRDHQAGRSILAFTVVTIFFVRFGPSLQLRLPNWVMFILTILPHQ